MLIKILKKTLQTIMIPLVITCFTLTFSKSNSPIKECKYCNSSVPNLTLPTEWSFDETILKGNISDATAKMSSNETKEVFGSDNLSNFSLTASKIQSNVSVLREDYFFQKFGKGKWVNFLDVQKAKIISGVYLTLLRDNYKLPFINADIKGISQPEEFKNNEKYVHNSFFEQINKEWMPNTNYSKFLINLGSKTLHSSCNVESTYDLEIESIDENNSIFKDCELMYTTDETTHRSGIITRFTQIPQLQLKMTSNRIVHNIYPTEPKKDQEYNNIELFKASLELKQSHSTPFFNNFKYDDEFSMGLIKSTFKSTRDAKGQEITDILILNRFFQTNKLEIRVSKESKEYWREFSTLELTRSDIPQDKYNFQIKIPDDKTKRPSMKLIYVEILINDSIIQELPISLKE